MYLGLDLSISNTGWAVIDKLGRIDCGSFPAPADKFPTLEARVRFIVANIHELVLDYDIEYIVFENYAFGAGKNQSNNLTKLAELKGALLFALDVHNNDIKYIDIATTQMKKYITGKGTVDAPKTLPKTQQDKYKKQVVIDAVNKLYHLEVTSSDAADAVGLVVTGYQYFTGVSYRIPEKDFYELMEARAAVIKAIKLKQTELTAKELDRTEKIERRTRKLKKNL